MRDRVIALRDAGVQIDALGQQGHFAPGLVNVGIDEGLDQRTRVDDYSAALETLAQAGLPIHITEVTFWNPLGPRSRLNLGLYDEDGNLTRHGEAILSLLNDRWRTRLDARLDGAGAITFTGTHGEYIAQWTSSSGPAYIRFDVPKGAGTLTVVAVQ